VVDDTAAIPCLAGGYTMWPEDFTPPAAGQEETIRLT